ncbi:MAG: hypothetical protein WAW11_05360 [Patescibacteria group bacterium]
MLSIIRKILGAIGLIAVFIWLSVFSLQTYQPDDVTFEAQDKSPLVSIIFDKLDFLLTYLGQMPSLGLLPVQQVAGGYEQTMTQILTENQVSGEKLNQPPTVKDLSELWADLKAKMQNKSLSTR